MTGWLQWDNRYSNSFQCLMDYPQQFPSLQILNSLELFWEKKTKAEDWLPELRNLFKKFLLLHMGEDFT